MIKTLEELICYLLYIDEEEPRIKQEICVGIIGDWDISDKLSIDLRYKIINLLREK